MIFCPRDEDGKLDFSGMLREHELPKTAYQNNVERAMRRGLPVDLAHRWARSKINYQGVVGQEDDAKS